jgi:hypothetical protein
MFSWLRSAAKTLDTYYSVAGAAEKSPSSIRKSTSVARR